MWPWTPRKKMISNETQDDYSTRELSFPICLYLLNLIIIYSFVYRNGLILARRGPVIRVECGPFDVAHTGDTYSH